MTEDQITGYATIGGFIVALVVAFALARIRYWKRAYLDQLQQTTDLLDKRSGPGDE